MISTFAGNGTLGFSGDGGPPHLAQMNIPAGMCMDPAGNIFISDLSNSRIRKINVCDLPVISREPLSSVICVGQNAVFTIEEAKGKQYHWERNTGSGWQLLTDDTTFSGTASKTLVISAADDSFNQNQFRCRITNDCGSVASESALLTVLGTGTLGITIQTPDTSICEGATQLFTATLINPGTSTVYKWRKNGLIVGGNNPNYSDGSLKQGDTITCAVSTVHPCLGMQQAISNKIAPTVKSLKTASVVIQVSANNICSGSKVNFTAIPVNGGIEPVYEWQINGIKSGNLASTFSPNTMINGDVITAVLTSSENCLVQNGVKSNEIVMLLQPNLVPAITISTNNNNVCSGTAVVFKAVAVNGGIAPIYQWFKNGQTVGVNADSYTDTFLRNGDVVTCRLTSNATCLQTPQAISAPTNMEIYNNPTVALDKNPEICTGGTRLLDAGNYSAFQWQNGSTQRTLTVAATGVYHVTVTDGNGCTDADTVAITTLLPRPQGFLPADSSLCSYEQWMVRPTQSYKSYLWSDGSTGNSLTAKAPGIYGLQVTDSKNCVGTDSIRIFPKDCITGFFAPTAFTPNGDGLNDTFKPLLYGNVIKYNFSLFNRYGQVVFTTTNYQLGWNGMVKLQKQPGNIYAWVCNYQLEGGEEKVEKGSVVLVR